LSPLVNDISLEIEKLIKETKKIIYELHNLYKKTKDEDLIEVKLIKIFNKSPKIKQTLKILMTEALKETDISEKDKIILKEIIEEAYLATNLQENLKTNTKLGKLLESAVDKCSSTNAKNS